MVQPLPVRLRALPCHCPALLWCNTVNDEVWVWLMDGTARLSETWVATVPDTGYRVIR